MPLSPTVLVIGAGTTGIGAAVRLTELGVEHVVVDAAHDVGGMSTSVTDAHGFTWDLGGHVLHSHFPEFDEAVAASGVGINPVVRNGWVWLRGDGPQSLVPTPVQQQLAEIPTDLLPDAPVENLADYYRNHFGQALYDDFFEPYNRKMWTVGLDAVDHAWTSLRSGSGTPNVPVLALAGSLPPVPAEEFPYPLGGTGALWRGVQRALMTPDTVRLGTRVVGLDPVSRVAKLDDGSTLAYEHCISTAPVTEALDWIGLGPLSGPSALKSSRVHAIGVGFRGTPPPALADKTWLYCPDETVPWYRATMLSTYDPGNAGEGRWNVLCEVSSTDDAPLSSATTKAVVASLVALGADPGSIESTFERTLAMGYPVPTVGRDHVLRHADAALRHHGIWSRGRFGGWRYESSNQDYGYLQGRQAVDAALFGQPEDVYWHPERF